MAATLKTLVVIPARMASRRFPGKPLAELRGKPVVRWVWEAARRAPSVERAVIAADGPEIRDAARGFGAEVVMTDPEHPTGSDRVGEAARVVGGRWGAILNLQGDEPLVAPEAIEAAIGALARDASVDVSTLAAWDHDPQAFAARDVVKVATDRRGLALYFSRAPLADPVDGKEEGWGFLRHVGLYAFRPAALETFTSSPPSPLELAEGLEQLRALEHGLRIRVVVTPYRNRAVDTPADLETLERDWDQLVSARTARTIPPGAGRKR